MSMNKRAVLVPCGWPRLMRDLRPGYFAIYDADFGDFVFGFKPEYMTNGKPEVFNERGEYFSYEPDIDMFWPLDVRWEEV